MYQCGDEDTDVELGHQGQVSIFTIVWNAILRFIKGLFSYIAKTGRKYHIDDVIAIVRPFVYVYSVWKCGRKSYQPI
jgi:hypothetical protein